MKREVFKTEHNLPLIHYEKRAFPLKLEKIAVETRDQNGRNVEVLTGRAAVFEEFTTITDRWGDTFEEKFKSGCMTETLSDGHKIMALYNHDWSCLMGSTSDNLTLTLKPDGLYFEMYPKGFEFDRRVTEFIKGGTVDGCSIGYRTTDEYWEEKDGVFFRIIQKIELYEMSFTPIPAYESTSVDVEVRKLSADETRAGEGALTAEERGRMLAETEELLNAL